RELSMKKFLLVLFTFAAIGCAHAPDYPLPGKPEFSTDEGRNCAIKCQTIHDECKSPASECNQELDQCYQLCKELLE
ncbi:MAG: hypothetical protein OEV22_11155, partial [Deltaproteobacteria bacterium]|nr:hypothetical protein [Deltaproteobacteria bacterium]